MTTATNVTNKMTIELFLEIIEKNPETVLEHAAQCQNMPSNVTLDEIKEKAEKMLKSYTSKSKPTGPTLTYRENESRAKELAAMMGSDDLIDSAFVCDKFGLQHKQKATPILKIAIALGLIEKAPKMKGVSLVRYRLVGSTAGDPVEETEE